MRLTRDGLDISVEPQVFELLVMLAENPDRLVTKDEIVEKVWQGRSVSDGAITSRINAVRKAVGDDGRTQRVIRTIPMRGFRFVAELEREQAAQVPSQNNCTIAVMPFRNLSSDPEQKFFAEGMLEDLVMKLSRVRWMQVIASATTATYSADLSDPGSIAKALDVRYLVTGSIRKSENMVRVGAQLMDAQNGWSIWAENFDRELDDIFNVQDEITATVVAMVENEVGNVEQADAERANPTKLEAWTLYHKGMSRLRNDAALMRNVGFTDLFDQAIALDPQFALARSARAFSEYWAFIEGQREADFDLAFENAERAITIDPREPFAHHALGALHFACRNHESSIAAFDRALELNPSFAWSMHLQATNFAYLCDTERANILIDEAIRLSPRDTLIGLFLAMKSMIRLVEGKFDETVKWGRKAMAYPQPRWVHLYVLSASAHLGQWDEVEDVLTIISRLRPEFTLNYVDKTFPLFTGQAKERMLEGLRKAGLPSS
ncbi:winged helix-turn-helix domain-containing protein [Shimia sp.]|uniref:winged helix-turn-helix domain-containing tetratricopeptide repeat protein n=1 Tax=Shimia sp. TaxID=1954381 RepID=UPI0032974635